MAYGGNTKAKRPIRPVNISRNEVRKLIMRIVKSKQKGVKPKKK